MVRQHKQQLIIDSRTLLIYMIGWQIREGKKNLYVEVVDSEGWASAIIKWDGCINLRRYANTPLEHRKPNEEDPCDEYVHICDIDRYIAELQALKLKALEYFSGEWPR